MWSSNMEEILLQKILWNQKLYYVGFQIKMILYPVPSLISSVGQKPLFSTTYKASDHGYFSGAYIVHYVGCKNLSYHMQRSCEAKT